MRNLKLYPITSEETDRLIDNMKKKVVDEGALGDTRPLVLGYLKEFLSGNKQFEKFLETKKL